MSESDVGYWRPITEVHVRLRRTSNIAMPRHRHRQAGHGGGEHTKKLRALKE